MRCAARVVAAAITVLFALPARPGDDAGRTRPGTVWDGVYTEVQAKRGERIYPDSCGRCHGERLDGAPDDPDMIPTPPIAGSKFLREWDGRSLASVFAYTKATMPANNPGFLADREFADLVAYMLYVSRMPAGDAELVPDPERLEGIEIRQDGTQ